MKIIIPTSQQNAKAIYELEQRAFVDGNNKSDLWLKKALNEENLNKRLASSIPNIYKDYLKLSKDENFLSIEKNEDTILEYLRSKRIEFKKYQEVTENE